MKRFDIAPTPIEGLLLLTRKPIGDSRGYLERLFCQEELTEIMARNTVVQINHTFTKVRGTVRGMHFQRPPHAEMKLVSCLRGAIFDVAIDLRRNSSTFLRWHAETLTEDNYKTFIIPEGFAHGFQTLSDDCEMLYFHTAAFRAEAEGGLHPQDPRLGIEWPLPVGGLSARDANHALVTECFSGLAP
ncbi:MAG TPA: dTDP-4-dehydrorhamnose 3,5-epimerase family protein [Nitrospira sp.]|nr:dTDP-4-dehydrorhamnose 3,5-epimerase family protein [Nitrospira sp.]